MHPLTLTSGCQPVPVANSEAGSGSRANQLEAGVARELAGGCEGEVALTARHVTKARRRQWSAELDCKKRTENSHAADYTRATAITATKCRDHERLRLKNVDSLLQAFSTPDHVPSSRHLRTLLVFCRR